MNDPVVSDQLPEIFCPPDYNGNNVVNVLATLIRAGGGASPHPDLTGLDPVELARKRHLIYLVLDGLGEYQLKAYLETHPDSPFFGRHPRRVITTVFPATTASAVTTFSTGATPAEHGILSWYLHLHDLGAIATILISTTRTGMPLIPRNYDWRAYINAPDYLAGVTRRRLMLTMAHIPLSRFTRAVGSWQTFWGYHTRWGFRYDLGALLRRRDPTLAYAYWPRYDSHCHEFGCFHPKTVGHLEKLDKMLARVAPRVARSGAALCIFADHGLVDVPKENAVDLRDIPDLYSCFSTLPAGDARQLACLVRPSREADFLRIVRERLGRYCVCLRGADLARLGVYGPGMPHPAFFNRVGDYILLARPNCAVAAPPAPAKPHGKIGNHGGMSPEEMRVPFYLIQ